MLQPFPIVNFRTTMSSFSSVVLFLSLISSSSLAFQLRIVPPMATRQQAARKSASSADNYLSSLSRGMPTTMEPPLPESMNENESITTFFSHAPFSYFALDRLTPKGPRKNADVGQPHDATRQLVEVGSISAGSWWCAEGGWPSPALRTTTEVFYVFSGHGCVTDLDGTKNEFRKGDTVILPKGWSGRWDIMQPIHKVWFVHEHPNIEETSNPIRAVITPSLGHQQKHMSPQFVLTDATHGSPTTALSTIYNVGPTKVGFWTCTGGSFPVTNLASTECFHVLEGVFFLANADGSARRCVAGDTVVLPKGWSGHWDVIETVKKLWVVVA